MAQARLVPALDRSEANARLSSANPNTIHDKILVGYQGWFTCAGDGEPIGPGHHGWLHWFNSPLPNGGHPNIDLWPDTSEYDPSELYPVPGLTTRSGDPVHLFSSRNPRTVHRHFHWMALHGVDGAFLQRFASECEVKSGNHGLRNLRDEVGDRVREAAEAEGRVFAIMYDVSGVSPDKIQTILEQDWMHLIADKRVIDSPNYLHENGRPVVELWGFGFNGRNHTPELVRRIADFFRSHTPGGVYLVAGVPGHWRSSTSDADQNPGFVQVWTECFDAISPWTVGRYSNEEEADRWGEQRVKADAEYLKQLHERGGRRIDYIPVVLPGGSGFNLSRGKWGMNDIRRNGGRFLWRQIYNARRAGVRTIYGAMWDEYDEGTVLMPVVPYATQLPVHSSHRFIALDIDGQELPPDWYMRIIGFAAEAFHGERTMPATFPFKELQDYWSTRPRYENTGNARQSKGDVDGVTRAFGEWRVSGGQADMPPDAPPPYSLEDTSGRSGLQAPWAQGAAVPPGGTGRRDSKLLPPPPVSQDTRPSPSQSSLSTAVHAAAVPLAATAVAHTLSAGSAGPRRPSIPPPVDMSTRPIAPLVRPHPHHAVSQSNVLPPPPPPRQGHGHGHMPEPVGIHRPASVHHPHADPVDAFSHVTRPREKHRRGRSRSRSKHRSRSHSHSRSHSRSRSRSHSKSRRRRSSAAHHKGGSPVYAVHPARVHSHSQSYSPHEHGHGHTLSPVGSSHGMGFPAPVGLHHAHSDSGYGYAHGHGHGHGHPPVRHGSYTPAHSVPVGYGDVGQGSSPGAYAPYGEQTHPGYATNYPNPNPTSPSPNAVPHQGYPGFGYPEGQRYETAQPYSHGYTPHPSSSSPYYTSYVPGTETMYSGPAGTSNASAGGAGRGIQGGIASALQAVEGLAGKQTRQQLEKTVQKLNNSLNKKFK